MSKSDEFPKFKNEGEEADWWASPAGRTYLKKRSAEAMARGEKLQPSPLVTQMRNAKTTQIAIRLPEADIAAARKIAERKGVGYQTLIKMILHEGLAREGRG